MASASNPGPLGNAFKEAADNQRNLANQKEVSLGLRSAQPPTSNTAPAPISQQVAAPAPAPVPAQTPAPTPAPVRAAPVQPHPKEASLGIKPQYRSPKEPPMGSNQPQNQGLFGLLSNMQNRGIGRK